jgi:hypothetical protein
VKSGKTIDKKVVKRFVTDTIHNKWHINVPAYKLQGYVYKALETIAHSDDLKHGKVESNIPTFEESDGKFYDWIEERE